MEQQEIQASAGYPASPLPPDEEQPQEPQAVSEPMHINNAMDQTENSSLLVDENDSMVLEQSPNYEPLTPTNGDNTHHNEGPSLPVDEHTNMDLDSPEYEPLTPPVPNITGMDLVESPRQMSSTDDDESATDESQDSASSTTVNGQEREETPHGLMDDGYGYETDSTLSSPPNSPRRPVYQGRNRMFPLPRQGQSDFVIPEVNILATDFGRNDGRHYAFAHWSEQAAFAPPAPAANRRIYHGRVNHEFFDINARLMRPAMQRWYEANLRANREAWNRYSSGILKMCPGS